MTTFVNTNLPKICHARPGQFLRLPDPSTGEVLPEIFQLVVVEPRRGSRPLRKASFGASAGLYNEPRDLMLLSLTSGSLRGMPHLSSRADLLGLKLEEVLPAAFDAPVLVSTLEQTVVRVTLSTGSGRVHRVVNLSKPDEVMGLLKGLAITADHVTEVKTSEQVVQEKAKECWRKAVAAGETLASFEEFTALI